MYTKNCYEKFKKKVVCSIGNYREFYILITDGKCILTEERVWICLIIQ